MCLSTQAGMLPLLQIVAEQKTKQSKHATIYIQSTFIVTNHGCNIHPQTLTQAQTREGRKEAKVAWRDITMI